MKIDRPVFDLADYVALELAIQRVKYVIRSPGAIVFGVAPVKMMVIDKSSIKEEAAVRC